LLNRIGHDEWSSFHKPESTPSGHADASRPTGADTSPGVERIFDVDLLDQPLLVGHFALPGIENCVPAIRSGKTDDYGCRAVGEQLGGLTACPTMIA
jgi:hypothetical protein